MAAMLIWVNVFPCHDVCVGLFEVILVAALELFIWLSTRVVSGAVPNVPFLVHFDVVAGIWNLIVSIPDHYMSHVTRKLVFGVCDQLRLEQAFSPTETS